MDSTKRIDALYFLKNPERSKEKFIALFNDSLFFDIYSNLPSDVLDEVIVAEREDRVAERAHELELAKIKAKQNRCQISEKLSVIERPSSATAREIESKKVEGVLCCNFALVETMIKLYIKNENESNKRTLILNFARSLMKHLKYENNDRCGPRKEGEPSREIVITSIFSSALQHYQSTIFNAQEKFPSVIWCHQMEVARGRMDVCGYQRGSRGWKPRVVWEFSINAPTIENQIFAYVNNLDSQTEDGSHSLFVIGIVVVLARVPTIEMKAYYKARDESQYKLAVVDMLEEKLSAESLTTVLEAIHCWMCFDDDIHEAPRLHQRNVIVHEGFVTKIFDYRNRSVKTEDRRKHELSMEFIPAGCSCVVKADDLVIIRYPFIAGTHLPSSLKQLEGVLQHLERIHDRGYVHMDIRASNLVFSSSGGAVIDFDFCSPIQSARYPSNYSVDIRDGKRHDEVACEEEGKVIHDLFALAQVLRLCDPVNKRKYESHWNDICSNLENGSLKDALMMVQEHDEDYSLSTEYRVDSGVGIGSPPKKSAGDVKDQRKRQRC